MRLWSIHPKYLDRTGLVAVWRESLLAQKVLQGATRGYRHHPQLIRFQQHPQPVAAISAYLRSLWEEAARRDYRFDQQKIAETLSVQTIPVTTGQLRYEFDWLRRKLHTRDPQRYQELQAIRDIESHPLFSVYGGDVETWEKVPDDTV